MRFVYHVYVVLHFVGMIRRDSVASGSILLTLNLTPNQNHYLSHAFLFLLYSPYKNHF